MVDSCILQWQRSVRQVNWMETWAEDEMCNEYMDIYYDLQSWLDKKGSEASQELRDPDSAFRGISGSYFANSSKQCCRMTSSII